MPSSEHPPWQYFMINAAIDYFTTRQLLPCLLIDNNILKDGVLESRKDPSCNEFVICVGPGYVTLMDFSCDSVTIAIRFTDMTHTLTIPFNAIIAVTALGIQGVLSDNGHTNVIGIPPMVLAPGHQVRQGRSTRVKPDGPAVVKDLEVQPQQVELSLYRKIG